MKTYRTDIPEVVVLEPRVFGDARGYFFESYSRACFAALGISSEFVQDNESCSAHHVLRGLHYQLRHTQGKLVRVVHGAILDVAVDVRRSSPTFGQWVAEELTADNKRMLWIPRGFAHGFLTLSDSAVVLYKADEFYAPEDERTILWNDPDLAIRWTLAGEPILSPKDAKGVRLRDAEVFV